MKNVFVELPFVIKLSLSHSKAVSYVKQLLQQLFKPEYDYRYISR